MEFLSEAVLAEKESSVRVVCCVRLQDAVFFIFFLRFTNTNMTVLYRSLSFSDNITQTALDSTLASGDVYVPLRKLDSFAVPVHIGHGV